MKKIRDLILYKDARFYSSFPSAAVLPQGRFLIVFRRARETRWLLPAEVPEELAALRTRVDHVDARSQLVATHYDRQTGAVSKPVTLSPNPEAADQDASLLALSNGKLLLSSFSWYPYPAAFAPVVKPWGRTIGSPEREGCLFLFWGGFTRHSDDGGVSWSEHAYLPALPNVPDIIPGRRAYLGGGVRGQAVEWRDEILLPVYEVGAHLFASADGGNNWTYRGCIAQDSSGVMRINEPALVVTPSGAVVALMRSQNGRDRLIEARSADGGRSWSTWRECAVVGHPFHPLKLPDQRVLLSYGYRHSPYGIRARILDPECSNIDESEEFIVRDDGFCPDLGYPWAICLDDSTVLIIYYFCGVDTIRHIAATEIAL